jgi:hypothetical protein
LVTERKSATAVIAAANENAPRESEARFREALAGVGP